MAPQAIERGGMQGQDASMRNATTLHVAEGAEISASATQHGDGGEVILWSDHLTYSRGRISVRGLFEGGAGSPYRFWGGFNPASILAMIAGVLTYLYLLNPITYASRSPYEYVTASLPTALVAGVVFALVTALVVRPAGKGGYE